MLSRSSAALATLVSKNLPEIYLIFLSRQERFCLSRDILHSVICLPAVTTSEVINF